MIRLETYIVSGTEHAPALMDMRSFAVGNATDEERAVAEMFCEAFKEISQRILLGHGNGVMVERRPAPAPGEGTTA